MNCELTNLGRHRAMVSVIVGVNIITGLEFGANDQVFMDYSSCLVIR